MPGSSAFPIASRILATMRPISFRRARSLSFEIVIMLFRKPGHSPCEGGLQTEEIVYRPRSDLVEQAAYFGSQIFDSEGLGKQMLAGIEHAILNDCIARVAGGEQHFQ